MVNSSLAGPGLSLVETVLVLDLIANTELLNKKRLSHHPIFLLLTVSVFLLSVRSFSIRGLYCDVVS